MTALVRAIAELEERAGASDQDRDLWLAERMGGVTATEVRDLYLRKRTVADMVALKLGRRVDTFSGNQYTAWGKTREPVLAELVREILPDVVPESRVFHAADEARYLASPDGRGVHDGQLVVTEIKTSKHDVRLGTEHFVKAGYAAQMTWSMRVTGARKCLYVTEQHDSDWQDRGGQYPEPSPVGLVPTMQWFEYDVEFATQLEAIAAAFLVALDAARAGDESAAPAIDEELDTLAVNYLRGLDAEKQGKSLKESSYRAIVALVDAGEPVVQESPLARVSWSPEVVEERPVLVTDVAAAKAANPELYARLERAQDDASQATAALDVEARAVMAHEASFRAESGVERVVVKKSALRVTAAKSMKEKAA